MFCKADDDVSAHILNPIEFGDLVTARKRYAIVANGGYCRMLLDAIDQKFKNDAELIAFAPWEGERLAVTGTKGQAEYFRPNAEPDEFWPAPLVT